MVLDLSFISPGYVHLDIKKKVRQEGSEWRRDFCPHFCGVQPPSPEVLPGDCGSKKEETAQKGQRRIVEWFGLETKIILQ